MHSARKRSLVGSTVLNAGGGDTAFSEGRRDVRNPDSITDHPPAASDNDDAGSRLFRADRKIEIEA
ncbi:MAG: hypothetical protein AUI88_01405 [Gemmatimonadetes bacterium 13_1_40CM_3_70_8]|nr:MAG: hypothetical protein AUI88_01405 [Gemmatimonadetes bacterium 13_1_40CM_3_70_8]